MPTAAEIAASKEAQQLEGVIRTPINPETGLREADPHQEPLNDVSDPPDDGSPSGNNDDSGDQGAPRGRPKPIHMSPSDEARANIAKRFRRDEEGRVPFNGDPNDPEMLYGKAGRQEPEPEPEPAPEPEPVRQQQQPQPEMITLKVRGKDVTKSRDEWLADAAKVTAADSYLDEGRQILDNARQIHRDNRERNPADPHRPEDRNNTQDDGATLDADGNPQHPGDELEAAIEEVRYGTDSKEAAQKLRKVIGSLADKAADHRQIQRLIGQDDTRSASALKTFIEANPDIANDQRSARLMESELYDIQREELIKSGTDAAQLPKENRALAEFHQLSRIHGMPVSSPEQMLEAAKVRVQSWRGVSSKPQAEQRRTEKPRVEVTVDRNARRAQLPNQPTRTMAPTMQRTQNEPAAPRDRSSVIENMRKARGQITG